MRCAAAQVHGRVLAFPWTGDTYSHGALPVPLVARLSVEMVPYQSITPSPARLRLGLEPYTVLIYHGVIESSFPF